MKNRNEITEESTVLQAFRLYRAALAAAQASGSLSAPEEGAPFSAHDLAAALWLRDGANARFEAYRRQVEAALRCAHPRMRVILYGYYVLGQTDQALADALHLTREHVNREKHRFLRSLDRRTRHLP